MIGVISSLVAGLVMSLQGVFNTRLSEKIGMFSSNFYVQATAAVVALLAMLIAGRPSFSGLREAPPYALFGGAIGAVITFTVVLGMKQLSPTAAVSIILISQLLTAALIDAFGLFGQERMPFNGLKYLGLALMLAGIILFKLPKMK